MQTAESIYEFDSALKKNQRTSCSDVKAGPLA